MKMNGQRLELSKSQIYFLSLFLSQLSAACILYFKIKGNYGPTFSPIQPDSVAYICKGFSWSSLPSDQQAELLSQIRKSFNADYLSCNVEPDFYKPRLLLSFLISIVVISKIWWFVFLPTLFFHFISLMLWYQLTKSWASSQGVLKFVFALSPWLSPFVAGHSLLVLTEGPLLTFALLMFYLAATRLNKKAFIVLIVACDIGGMLTRQSWLIFAFLTWYVLISKHHPVKRSTSGVYLFSAAFAFGGINKLISSGTDYIAISDGINMKFIEGICLGIAHDFSNAFRNFDLMGIFVCLIVLFFPLFSRDFTRSLLILGLNAYSFALVGLVYVKESVFGQNWRYFLPATFLGVLLIIRHPESLRGLRWSLLRKHADSNPIGTEHPFV